MIAMRVLEVLWTFFLLGISAFGGPVAHLGYFRRTFVENKKWVDDEEYGALLALCQFLPGPASSQVGFCVGLHRAGFFGGLAAWIGFTLPSAVIMVALAHYLFMFQTSPLARGAVHGLQLAAVAVVAQALYLMARSLCPDTPRRALALLCAAVLGLMPGTLGQILVLIVGALTGWATLDDSGLVRHRETHRLAREWPTVQNGKLKLHVTAVTCLIVFSALLLAALFVPLDGSWALAGAFYRSGALVFGGGHVVLPLLRDAVVGPGWITPQAFLAGYGAAQAMPGPLFTVASYLGALTGGYKGAAIATCAIFLPGFLLIGATLPYWQALRARPYIAAMMKGLNAAVVGLLGAAFIDLLTLSTLQGLFDLPIILFALLLLTAGRARPILVVIFCAAAGAVA